MKHLYVCLSVFCLACSTAGCTQAKGQGTTIDAALDENGFDPNVPPIYVAQTIVLLIDGKPQVETGYRKAAAICRNDPSFVALSESDARKLGRTYYQLWFEGKSSALQKDVWDYQMGGIGDPCHFRVTHESSKVIFAGKYVYDYDLIAKRGVRELRQNPEGGGSGGSDDDDQLDPGSAQLGFQRLGYSTSAGQRCLHWRDPSGNESCTWSEGFKWGFSRREGSNESGSYDPGFIVLWVRPAEGNGIGLTTQKMTVGGEPFGNDIFSPPSGMKTTEKSQ